MCEECVVIIYCKGRCNENYLKTIIRGIQETYDNINKEEIIEYLITKKGIENNYNREELINLFDS